MASNTIVASSSTVGFLRSLSYWRMFEKLREGIEGIEGLLFERVAHNLVLQLG
jgi:hypothetical protein